MWIKTAASAISLSLALIAAPLLAQPAPGDAENTAQAAEASGNAETTRTYVVRKGDSLSRIAKRFYGNSVLWLPILNANVDKVKGQRKLIFPGTTLMIPSLEEREEQIFTAAATPESQLLPVVTGNDYAPFTDKNLPEGGLFTELVKVAMTRAGYKPDIEFLPWDYAMRATQKSTFKASFPWYETKDRREALWYSRPVYEVLIVVYHKAGAPLQFDGIDDLNGLNLCRPEGYFDDDISAKVAEGLIIRTAPTTPGDCFNMLVSGDVDVVSLSAMVGNGEIIKAGFEDQIEVAETPLAIRPLHIVYPKFDPRSRGVMGKIDVALKAMEKEGVMAQVIEKHLRSHFEALTKAKDSREVASSE